MSGRTHSNNGNMLTGCLYSLSVQLRMKRVACVGMPILQRKNLKFRDDKGQESRVSGNYLLLYVHSDTI